MTSTLPSTPLSRAATLPSRYYIDPDVLEAEKERIFGRTWQLVARTDELQRIGDFVPVTVLDEPVVITHAQDGQLKAFYNVCRHRAGQVALTRGNRKSLQCRYHGWTYGLDGCLRAAPEMDATEDFRKEDFGLIPVRVETWGPFVFVNLDASAPPLAEMMGGIPGEVARAGYDVDKMRLVERRDYVIECNWKVYVDNYLEGYHVPHIHPGLNKLLDYRSYVTETAAWYSYQYSPLVRADESGGDALYGEGDALYYWLWPNTMLNILPGRLQTNRVVPKGVDRCRVEFDFYYALDESEAAAQRRLADLSFSDEVQVEDLTICEDVQRGLSSGSYEPGRLNPLRENAVHHFHELLRRVYREAGQ